MSEATELLRLEIDRIKALIVRLETRGTVLALSTELFSLCCRAKYRRGEAERLQVILDMLELEEDQELNWKDDGHKYTY